MQTSLVATPPAADPARPPWPDEMPRLRHFLPGAFLLASSPAAFVIVRGRVERIVAAAALSINELAAADDGDSGRDRVGWLSVRISAGGTDYAALARTLSSHALARAWAAGAARVCLGRTVAEDSEEAQFWQGLGYTRKTTYETYEISARPFWERLERIRLRLRAGGLLPEGISLLTVLPRLVEPVRRFLLQHLPGSVSMLAVGSGGYRPEHSLVLLVRGEVKGVLLARLREGGGQATIGLRVVAPELRGGLGWANLLLLHESLGSGLQSGLERSRFELDPATHADTLQMAHLYGGRLVGRRLLLDIGRENRVDGMNPAV